MKNTEIQALWHSMGVYFLYCILYEYDIIKNSKIRQNM